MNAENQLQRLLVAPEYTTLMDRTKFRDWFERQFRKDECKVEDFAIYYLHMLRQSTEQHLRSSDGTDTPKCQTPVRTAKPSANMEIPVQNKSEHQFAPQPLIFCNMNSPQPSQQQQQKQRSLGTDSSHNESQGSSMFNNCSTNSQNLSQFDRSHTNSLQNSHTTPVRRNPNQPQHQSQGRRSQQYSVVTSTPQSSERRERSNNSSTGLCLGDFLTTKTLSQSHKKKKSPQEDKSGNKPKKRVVPTKISKNASPNPSSPFGNKSSAFSNENNLRLSDTTEIVDPNKCAVLEARKSLKLHANEISKELNTSQTSTSVSTTAAIMEGLEEIEYLPPPPIDLTKITQASTLDTLAAIYAQLIDLNLVPNVLSELAYMLQLLNLPESSCAKANELLPDQSKPLTLLYEFPNCIYFSLRMLNKQCQLLIQLDLKSLGVVLNNERFALLDKSLQYHLELAYQTKQNIQNHASSQPENMIRLDSSCKNVYYQHEKDSREHFPTQNEFAAFKTQRDLFYSTYKQWETNHLNPNFNFGNDLAKNILDIFHQSEHPVNMAHFAKLFVSQLLISAKDATTTPQELGIEMDQEKFSKLTQRLFAPSNFSVDYQFPRSQAYFRDFINECGSMAFQVQLKLALYAQLKEFNDSTFEQLQFSSKIRNLEEDETAQQLQRNSAFIVRPDELNSMLILAKFLGYVTALPYGGQREEYSQRIVQKQLELRSQFQPEFNICSLLQSAIHDSQLLVTLPWLVQYLAMLDNITLQLADFTATLHLLFEIYSRLGVISRDSQKKIVLQPTAVFIIRCCIGWLLETKSHIPSQYYNYRAMRCSMPKHELSNDLEELINTTVACLQIKDKQQSALMHFDNTLEQLLNVACPFLPEFRVTIMPAKYALTKCASRTGRYRHITTRFAVLSTPSSTSSSSPTNIVSSTTTTPPIFSTQQLNQRKLVDAFLHSQHASMRRLIEFVIERTYKSVVKDAQISILRSSKAEADKQVNEEYSNQYYDVLFNISAIYGEARERACKDWRTQVPVMIEARIRQALDALLPTITNDVIKRTYHQLIARSVNQKVEQYLQSNVLEGNFYCSDRQELATKLCRVNMTSRKTNSSTELCIVPNAPCAVSDLMDELKYWLHVTSMRPDLVTKAAPIEDFLGSISGAFVHTLPTVFYRLLGAGLVQLFQHLICRHTALLTRHMIETACSIWTIPEMLPLGKRDNTMDLPSNFDSLITVNFIELLGGNCEAFGALKHLLRIMIDSDVISVNFLNEAFMPIFKHDWPLPVWNEMSEMLRCIEQATNGRGKKSGGGGGHYNYDEDSAIEPEDEAKSHMFMEVLSDLSRDLDF